MTDTGDDYDPYDPYDPYGDDDYYDPGEFGLDYQDEPPEDYYDRPLTFRERLQFRLGWGWRLRALGHRARSLARRECLDCWHHLPWELARTGLFWRCADRGACAQRSEPPF